MTDKEVRKLNRVDLLKLLIDQTEENQRLTARISQLEQELSRRTITLENSGSIAEAALGLSGVFTQAQDAADRYLESICQKQTQAEQLLRQAQDTLAAASQKEAETRQKCQQLEEKTRQLCARLLEQTRAPQPADPPQPPAPEQLAPRRSLFGRR